MVQAVDLLAHRVRARAREQRQIESLIRRSGGLFLKPDELAGALGDFSKAFPANPLSADFVVAVRMAPFWGAYADWESAAAGWRDAPCVKDASTARERLTKIEDIVTRRGASLPTERAEDYVAYLQHSQRVLAGRSYAAGISEIESILHSSLMRSLYVVCVSAGDGSELVYYTRSNLLKGTGSVTGPDGRTLRTYGFDYVVDGSLATTYEVVDTGSLLSKPNLSPAPQTALAEQALIIIGEFRLSGAGWETLDLQLAEMTAACPDIDPILRANLMRIFLDRAVAFVPFERDAVNTLAERIRKIDNDVRWIDPYDIQANNVRAHVSSELERIGSLSGLVKAVQDRISLAAGPRPVAVMLGPDMSVSAVGTLFVMRQDSPSKARFEKIGEAKDGKMALDEGAECPCGSIIYAGR